MTRGMGYKRVQRRLRQESFFLKRPEKEATCDKLAKTERSLEDFSSSPHNEQGDPE